MIANTRSYLLYVMQRTFDDLGTPLCNVTFCVIDLETTGGSPHDDGITEIGAVKVRGGECLGTFQTLVNPGRAIPPTITLLTGISESMVYQAPRIDQVLPTLLEFCGDAVLVAHNARFDIGFLNAALQRTRRPHLANLTLDTVALARRLLVDDVPNCRLGTLAERFRFEHRPSHRALDDALATVDLLHLLIERAAAFGVLGLDDLQQLPRLAGHPHAAKLKLTNHLPRRPGVYMFQNAYGEVLYVGKATNLRQRVRSYFGHDDRRKIGPMLREAQSISFHETPDPLCAEVLELRFLHQLRPRYNKQGTTWDRYAYVRLAANGSKLRLSVTKDPIAAAFQLGPLPSRAMAKLVVEAIELAVAVCEPADAVQFVFSGLTSRPELLLGPLGERMKSLASNRRFEAAAATRDRAQALSAALRRQRLIDEVRNAGLIHLAIGETEFVIDQGRLIQASLPGRFPDELALPPPAAAEELMVLPRDAVDEVLCVARHLEHNRPRIVLQHCGGIWAQPCDVLATFEPRSHQRAAA